MKFIIGVKNMGNSIEDNEVKICEICRDKLSDAIKGCLLYTSPSPRD